MKGQAAHRARPLANGAVRGAVIRAEQDTMNIRAPQRGVTIIELAIVLAIFATLAVAAIPDVNAFIARSQVRAAADALRGALRAAQIEALARGGIVEVVLTEDVPSSSAAWLSPSTGGRNFVVRAQTRAGAREVLYEHRGSLLTPRVRVAADRAVFRFDAFGRLRAESICADAPDALCAIHLDDGAAGTASHAVLQVRVGPGGSSTACNPDLPTGSSFACS